MMATAAYSNHRGGWSIAVVVVVVVLVAMTTTRWVVSSEDNDIHQHKNVPHPRHRTTKTLHHLVDFSVNTDRLLWIDLNVSIVTTTTQPTDLWYENHHRFSITVEDFDPIMDGNDQRDDLNDDDDDDIEVPTTTTTASSSSTSSFGPTTVTHDLRWGTDLQCEPEQTPSSSFYAEENNDTTARWNHYHCYGVVPILLPLYHHQHHVTASTPTNTVEDYFHGAEESWSSSTPVMVALWDSRTNLYVNENNHHDHWTEKDRMDPNKPRLVVQRLVHLYDLVTFASLHAKYDCVPYSTTTTKHFTTWSDRGTAEISRRRSLMLYLIVLLATIVYGFRWIRNAKLLYRTDDIVDHDTGSVNTNHRHKYDHDDGHHSQLELLFDHATTTMDHDDDDDASEPYGLLKRSMDNDESSCDDNDIVNDATLSNPPRVERRASSNTDLNWSSIQQQNNTDGRTEQVHPTLPIPNDSATTTTSLTGFCHTHNSSPPSTDHGNNAIPTVHNDIGEVDEEHNLHSTRDIAAAMDNGDDDDASGPYGLLNRSTDDDESSGHDVDDVMSDIISSNSPHIERRVTYRTNLNELSIMYDRNDPVQQLPIQGYTTTTSSGLRPTQQLCPSSTDNGNVNDMNGKANVDCPVEKNTHSRRLDADVASVHPYPSTQPPILHSDANENPVVKMSSCVHSMDTTDIEMLMEAAELDAAIGAKIPDTTLPVVSSPVEMDPTTHCGTIHPTMVPPCHFPQIDVIERTPCCTGIDHTSNVVTLSNNNNNPTTALTDSDTMVLDQETKFGLSTSSSSIKPKCLQFVDQRTLSIQSSGVKRSRAVFDSNGQDDETDSLNIAADLPKATVADESIYCKQNEGGTTNPTNVSTTVSLIQHKGGMLQDSSEGPEQKTSNETITPAAPELRTGISLDTVSTKQSSRRITKIPEETMLKQAPCPKRSKFGGTAKPSRLLTASVTTENTATEVPRHVTDTKNPDDFSYVSTLPPNSICSDDTAPSSLVHNHPGSSPSDNVLSATQEPFSPLPNHLLGIAIDSGDIVEVNMSKSESYVVTRSQDSGVKPDLPISSALLLAAEEVKENVWIYDGSCNEPIDLITTGRKATKRRDGSLPKSISIQKKKGERK